MAGKAIHISENAYRYLSENVWAVFAVLPVLLGVAFLLHSLYKKMPTLQGGGISEAMGLVGGVFSFNWLRSLVGTVTLSLLNFIIGVPLGNEGPSVQIGASIGKASTLLLGKKGEVWSRYCLTGGVCGGNRRGYDRYNFFD